MSKNVAFFTIPSSTVHAIHICVYVDAVVTTFFSCSRSPIWSYAIAAPRSSLFKFDFVVPIYAAVVVRSTNVYMWIAAVAVPLFATWICVYLRMCISKLYTDPTMRTNTRSIENDHMPIYYTLVFDTLLLRRYIWILNWVYAVVNDSLWLFMICRLEFFFVRINVYVIDSMAWFLFFLEISTDFRWQKNSMTQML